jgi:effector-binding domain-containing protein
MVEAEIRELTPQPTAAVRVTQPMESMDLAALFDEHLPNIAHRLADMGIEPAGPPFGRYHQFGPDQVDVEIGIPLAAPASSLRPLAEAEPGELGASELPGGQVAITIHRGAYDGLSKTYDALHDWIHAQPGYDDGDGPWESYVDMPQDMADPSGARTEVIWPLVRE